MPSWPSCDNCPVAIPRAAGDPCPHRQHCENVGLAPHVAPLAKLVLAQEMRRFVGDHSGQLRLVAHPQQQPGEYHRHAGREHRRVEFGRAQQIDAEIARRGPPTLPIRSFR